MSTLQSYRRAPAGIALEDVELFLSGETEVERRDGLMFLPIARTGTWKRSPLPGGRPLVIDEPLFNDVKQAFDAKAWEYVTVPLSHKDRVDENTGFIKALEIRDDPARPGAKKLWGGFKFTEPDVEGKVERRTIAGRSVGITLKGVHRTSDGKYFPRVLKHVALTNAPWLDGLDDEAIAAARDDIGTLDGHEYQMAYTLVGDGDGPDSEGADVDAPPPEAHYRVASDVARCGSCAHFDDAGSYCEVWRASVADDHVSDAYTARDIAPGGGQDLLPASREESTHTRGGDNMPEDPETGGAEGTEGAVADAVVELSRDDLNEMIVAAVAEDRAARDSATEVELAQNRREVRELRVAARMRELQEAGHIPAVLTVAEEIMLADNTDTPILALAQEGDEGDIELSATGIVERVLAAFPPTVLTLAQAEIAATTAPPEGEDINKIVDAAWEELHKDGAQQVRA
jgi:hypothetical protein